MRGRDTKQSSMLCLMSPEERVPADHALRRIKETTDDVLKRLSPLFDEMYASTGRSSVPPERLLKAMLLMALYSVRSERMFCEQLNYNLLRPKDDKDDDKPDGNSRQDFRGQQRSNDTHESKTDPKAELSRKGVGQPAKLCFSGHALMENRTALRVDFRIADANRREELSMALTMIEQSAARSKPITVGADRGYDVQRFVEGARALGATPHVAQPRERRPKIDARTTRHPGYTLSLRARMKIEEIFGWVKTTANFRRSGSCAVAA